MSRSWSQHGESVDSLDRYPRNVRAQSFHFGCVRSFRRLRLRARPARRPVAASVAPPTRSRPPQAAGGIKVSRADVEDAFHFLDTKRRGKIRMEDLRARLSAFYGDLPSQEYQFLLGDRTELTLGDLDALLRDNEITNFDPVAEAFKVYDPEGKGFVEPALLRQVFERLGFGALSDEDLSLLVESADADGDGRISLNDFRGLVDLCVTAAGPPRAISPLPRPQTHTRVASSGGSTPPPRP